MENLIKDILTQLDVLKENMGMDLVKKDFNEISMLNYKNRIKHLIEDMNKLNNQVEQQNIDIFNYKSDISSLKNDI